MAHALPRTGWSKILGRTYDFLADTARLGAIPAVTGLAVTEYGVGPVKRTVLTFTDVAFALVDNAGVVAGKGLKVYDMPEGFIKIAGAVANLALTKSSAGVIATWDGDFGVGTVVSNNDATLSATEQNIIPTTATPQAVAGVSSAKGFNAADIAPLDGHTTAVDIYLNLLVDDTDHDVTGTPANLIVNGTLELNWSLLGDYT